MRKSTSTRKPTLTQQVADLTALVEALVAAQAPVSNAPAKARAESPNGFVTFLRERAASKVGCGKGTPGCTRTFSPKSSGVNTHVCR